MKAIGTSVIQKRARARKRALRATTSQVVSAVAKAALITVRRNAASHPFD